MSLDILELVKIAFIKKRKHTRQQLLCFCKISAYGDSMTKKDTKLENLSKTVHMLIEEIRLSETEGLDRIFMDVYSQQADMMTDSRQQGKVKHAFRDILGIVFFGVLAGNDEWEDIYPKFRIEL